jgi:molybdate transport system regulatory protein
MSQLSSVKITKNESGVVTKLKIAKGRRWDHLELLERIDISGSITSAASAMGMSYKAAWEAVENIKNLSEHPLSAVVILWLLSSPTKV